MKDLIQANCQQFDASIDMTRYSSTTTTTTTTTTTKVYITFCPLINYCNVFTADNYSYSYNEQSCDNDDGDDDDENDDHDSGGGGDCILASADSCQERQSETACVATTPDAAANVLDWLTPEEFYRIHVS